LASLASQPPRATAVPNHMRGEPPESRVRHGRAGRAPVPPLLPLLQPSCACTELSIGGTRDCTSSLTSPPSLQAAGVPSPPVQAGSSRRSPWPGSHEPPPAVPRNPVGAREPGVAAAPVLRRRRASFGRQQQVRHAPLLLIPTRGLGLKFDKIEGSNCEVSDSKE